ncbi:hypothetical protein LZ32DRAFT_691831 [Colletotrichum eremochloae]|nr:hypothetical protein LZ32DRAFT_691831 [Colletotrichum eremochloae]
MYIDCRGIEEFCGAICLLCMTIWVVLITIGIVGLIIREIIKCLRDDGPKDRDKQANGPHGNNAATTALVTRSYSRGTHRFNERPTAYDAWKLRAYGIASICLGAILCLVVLGRIVICIVACVKRRAKSRDEEANGSNDDDVDSVAAASPSTSSSSSYSGGSVQNPQRFTMGPFDEAIQFVLKVLLVTWIVVVILGALLLGIATWGVEACVEGRRTKNQDEEANKPDGNN